MNLDLSNLRAQRITELVSTARGLGIDNAAGLKKQELIFEIVRHRAGGASGAHGEGVLETLPDGFGFLRSPDCSYLPGPDDIYVSPSQIRRFNLRTGDLVGGRVRAPKEGERYFALIKIEAVNGRSPDDERDKILFDNFAPLHPQRRIKLASEDVRLQMIDRFMPLGFGQRIAILTPQRAGRTSLIRDLCSSIAESNPGTVMMVLLVDERPEEVSAMSEAVDAEVLSSTFDEPHQRHVQVADMVLERAKRLVEQGRDVVLMVDSLSRLARAFNAIAPTGGRELRGGVDIAAIHRARRFFGAGRCLDGGGSLTIIATVLTDTAHDVDEVLQQEVQGTANGELRIDAVLVEGDVWPAIDVRSTFTRSVERLVGNAAADELRDFRRTLPFDRREAVHSAVDWLQTQSAAAGMEQAG
jgi:transcription termination factor Rho